MADTIIYFLGHFVFVFVSMVLFFVPFVGIFYIRNRQQIREKKPHFNQFMERFFASRESNYLVMIWAAAEALVWFIIPEFLLFLMIFMKVKHKINLLKFDIIGTVIGTIIGFIWHASNETMLKIPYVFQGMIDQTHAWFEQFGIWGLAFQPFSGVPYKVFISAAPEYGFAFGLFLVLAVIVRISRYFIAYELTKALFPLFHRFVRKNYAWLFIVGIAVFTGFLLKVSFAYGPTFVLQ